MYIGVCAYLSHRQGTNVILVVKTAILQLLNDHNPTKYKPPHLASVGNQHRGEPVIMKAINHFR